MCDNCECEQDAECKLGKCQYAETEREGDCEDCDNVCDCRCHLTEEDLKEMEGDLRYCLSAGK